MGKAAVEAGRSADRSEWFDHAVRFGLVTYGLVHLMIAWIAGQLALGNGGGNVSSSGALRQLAQQPFGAVLVWGVALGLLLLVAWRLLEAGVGHRDSDGAELWRKRGASVLRAALYGAIGVSALRIASGDRSSGGGTDSTTAKLMDLPAGAWIVGAIGLAVVGYGLNLVRRAWTEKFREHLTAEGHRGDSGTAYLWFGKLGYAAKGLAIVIVGGLFCYAALTHEPKRSGGLDQALHEVLQQPFGSVLLLVIAVGIGCYGLFCFARARHLSR